MDHFNATVKDGKLVNTRRGLQVSRQKFNGISFVNTSAQDSSSFGERSFRLSQEPSSKTASLPAIRFTDDTNNPQTSGNSANTELGQGLTPNLSFVAETGQPLQSKNQPRRRAAPKGQTHHRRSSTSPYLSSPDSRPSSRSSAVTSSPRAEEATFPFFASSFPVSQQHQPQSQQPFITPSVQHRQYHHAQHLQVGNLTTIPSQPLSSPWPPNESSSVPPSPYLSSLSPSQSDWTLFYHYNTHCLPLQLYPYEDILTYNPARSNGEECSIASSDVAAFHCVLMCGAIAEAVLNGQHHLSSEPETEARSFAYHISKICAILNKRLDGSEGGAVDAITLHCIAMLAWMGCYVGRLDHWHMHTRGLQKVLDVLGGLGQGANLPTWVVRRIHNADLKGATVLASTPYLPLTRSLSPSPTAAVLTPAHLAQTTHTLNSILQPLNIHPSTITALTALANFSSAIHIARQSTDTSVKFDPYAFTEELQSITYDLLTTPGPLQRDVREDIPLILPGGQENLAENLEFALRLASLLFLKDLLPEYPRNLGGYTTLLNLLRQHLQAITHLLSRQPQSANDYNETNELLDPRLRQQFPKSELKQVLIFLCLLGDISSHSADRNSCRHHDDLDTSLSEEGNEHEQSKEIFRKCLLSALDNHYNISDEDLEFVRFFDLRELVEEEGWSEREAVIRLLSTTS